MKAIITSLFILFSFVSFGQSVFVLAKDDKSRNSIKYELQSNGVSVADDMDNARYTVELQLKNKGLGVHEGVIILKSNKTGKTLYATETVKRNGGAYNGYNAAFGATKSIIRNKDFYAITDYLKEKAPAYSK